MLLISFSCNQSDDDFGIKADLIGSWIVKKEVTYFYIDGEIERVVETVFDKEPYNKLTFKSNQNVTYESINYTKMIHGKWTLNGKTLKTDLKIDIPPATGFTERYFLAENDIIKINDNELILKSPQIGGDQANFYTETFLTK